MTLLITAYHIDAGATRMYPVDVAQAIGAHPEEWSRVPWTDETRSSAKDALEAKRKAQADAAKRDLDGQESLIDGKKVIGAQTMPPAETAAAKPVGGAETGAAETTGPTKK